MARADAREIDTIFVFHYSCVIEIIPVFGTYTLRISEA